MIIRAMTPRRTSVVPGLPAIDAFRRREQARLLEGARRRLGL